MKEKGIISFLVVFVLILVACLGLLYYRYGSSDAIVKDLSNRLFPSSTNSIAKNSAANTKYPGSYKVQTNTDSTYSVYYRGKVLNISEDEHVRYSVTFQPQDEKGNNIGSTATFSLPNVPPKLNMSVLGKNFQEMVKKGLNPVNINILYNKAGQFKSWEQAV